MSDLRELYQEMILDHGKRPRHFERMEGANCSADGHNPLCGDRLTVFIQTDGEKIQKVSFQGNGCAISVASASMMSEALEGMPLAEAEQVFRRFHALVAGEEPAADPASLGKLAVFSGVRQFPVRVKCATLAWHTLRAALDRDTGDEPVKTE